MALHEKPPGSACAYSVRHILGCLALSLLLASVAGAETIGYDSWQSNGFSRTLIAPSPSSSPTSLLASILSSSFSSDNDNVVYESAIGSPAADPISSGTASLSGTVFFDANGNGVCDSSDWAIRDAIVSLTSASTNTVLIATSDKNGVYTFKSLPADDYTITLMTPSTVPGAANTGTLTDTSGTFVFSGLGVAVGTGSIADVQLQDGYVGTGYDFGQLVYPTSLISKRMLLNQDSGVAHTSDTPAPPIPPVPEPGTFALLVVAGLCFTGFRWRRRS